MFLGDFLLPQKGLHRRRRICQSLVSIRFPCWGKKPPKPGKLSPKKWRMLPALASFILILSGSLVFPKQGWVGQKKISPFFLLSTMRTPLMRKKRKKENMISAPIQNNVHCGENNISGITRREIKHFSAVVWPENHFNQFHNYSKKHLNEHRRYSVISSTRTAMFADLPTPW